MKRIGGIFLAVALCSGPAFAKDQSPQKALADAARYTVQVFRFSSVGLNADDGQSAKGTGFLFDRKRGWILTNAHVASRSPARIEVAFEDHDEVPARRIFVDHYIDMAVLEVDPKSIPVDAGEARLDCSQTPAVGTPVAIFGNPYDFRFVASRGIVSGISWYGQREHIQSDATINSGNSGGPLINLETGQVVGMAAESYRDTDDDHSTSVAFSEPMPPICTVIRLLRAGKDANVRLLDAAIATAPRDDRPIVAVTSANAAGLVAGDVIVSVNKGPELENPADLLDQLRGQESPVSLVVRRAGQSIPVETTTHPLPSLLGGRSIDLSGLVISEPWRLDARFSADKDRLVVDYILADTPAENLGVNPSAVILTVDGKPFGRVDELYAYLASKGGKGEVEFIVSENAPEVLFHTQFTVFRLGLDKLKWIEASNN